MQAIILAAGMGKRLGELTKNNTKCMVEVNGVMLIDRVLIQLSKLDLKKVVIVIGYEGDKLKEHIDGLELSVKIEYVVNPIYDKTNNIYSLFLAKHFLIEDDTLLLESDLIFEDSVLAKLVDAEYPNLALVDKYESWMDGTVVTIDDENNIKSFISKKDFDYSMIPYYFKTVNVYKFSKEFSNSQYVPFLEAYSKALGNNEYYEQVLRVLTLMDNSSIRALPLDGELWYEIDDIQDLDIAQSIFARTDEEHWKAYSQRYGGYWRYPKLLDFCYLVNPYFPNRVMIDEIKANFEVLLREYPSGMKVNSLLAAKYFHVDIDKILVGNGAAELIKAYMENYAGVSGVVFPTFEEYPNRLDKNKIVSYVPDNSDFSYTVDDLVSFFNDKTIDTLLLVNPDNPSGNYIPYDGLLRLLSWSKEKKIIMIIDESFVDFTDVSGQKSLITNDILNENKHLAVIKSISKSYGVPGLRLGVLSSGNIELISELKKKVAIWNINSFAEFYMQIFEKYEKDYQNACKAFIQERERFRKDLEAIRFLRVIPSNANYFLCEILGGISSTQLAVRLLKECGILIKDCSSKKGFSSKNYVRFAVRDKNDNCRLVDALIKIENGI